MLLVHFANYDTPQTCDSVITGDIPVLGRAFPYFGSIHHRDLVHIELCGKYFRLVMTKNALQYDQFVNSQSIVFSRCELATLVSTLRMLVFTIIGHRKEVRNMFHVARTGDNPRTEGSYETHATIRT